MDLITRAQQLLDLGGILLDARSQEEYEEGGFEGSVLLDIPLPSLTVRDLTLLAKKVNDLIQMFGKERPFIVFCKKGVRSSLVAAMLKNFGAVTVLDLEGIEKSPLKGLIEAGEIL